MKTKRTAMHNPAATAPAAPAPALLALAFGALALGALADAPGLAAQAAQTAQAPQATEAPAPVRASWTSDRHTLVMGDLVTVLVDESTLATSDVRDQRSQTRSRDLGIEGGAGGQGGAAGASSRADLNDRTRGESVRRERFATEISARVVESGPGGVVRVEGEKRIRVDGHEQIVSISGWLRPADLSGRNTIESWRMADVSVRYGASGDMRRVRGLWGRLIGRLWP